MRIINIRLLLIALLLQSTNACVYLKGSAAPRIHALYDTNRYAPGEVATLVSVDKAVISAIDGKEVPGDVLRDLRHTEYHLPPGYHTVTIKTELSSMHLNGVGTSTTIETKTLGAFFKPGRNYALRFDLQSSYVRYSWIEDRDTAAFISGYREVVEGTSARPPFAVKNWIGECRDESCTHIYVERHCEVINSCIKISKKCDDRGHCTPIGTFAY